MTSFQDLIAEVRASLADARTTGPVNARWLQQAIVNEHIRLGHVGSEWALCCVHEATSAVISKLLREVKAHENERELNSQLGLGLPGWNRLQRDYLVRRDGERWVVGLCEMTEAEIAQKARAHRKAGLGHYEHADELKQFLEQRLVTRANV